MIVRGSHLQLSIYSTTMRHPCRRCENNHARRSNRQRKRWRTAFIGSRRNLVLAQRKFIDDEESSTVIVDTREDERSVASKRTRSSSVDEPREYFREILASRHPSGTHTSWFHCVPLRAVRDHPWFHLLVSETTMDRQRRVSLQGTCPYDQHLRVSRRREYDE